MNETKTKNLYSTHELNCFCNIHVELMNFHYRKKCLCDGTHQYILFHPSKSYIVHAVYSLKNPYLYAFIACGFYTNRLAGYFSSRSKYIKGIDSYGRIFFPQQNILPLVCTVLADSCRTCL